MTPIYTSSVTYSQIENRQSFDLSCCAEQQHRGSFHVRRTSGIDSHVRKEKEVGFSPFHFDWEHVLVMSSNNADHLRTGGELCQANVEYSPGMISRILLLKSCSLDKSQKLGESAQSRTCAVVSSFVPAGRGARRSYSSTPM
jgi:hypothetical protein